MPFTLARFASDNIVTEVQRWQYFLLRMQIEQTGEIDGSFGKKTEDGTKIFQIQAGLPPNGKVNTATLEKAREHGYTVLPDDYYTSKAGAGFPPEPADLNTPSNDSRNQLFTCFKFKQLPLANRPDKEAIVITTSCDGTISDWRSQMIVDIEMPQLRFARGFHGRVTCHRRAAKAIRALIEAWEAADLLHLLCTYEGCFVPRYKRKQAPPGENGHSLRKSSDVPELSNHAFGSAFDVNAGDNGFGDTPQAIGRRGCTREFVAIANQKGFYWGGHFGTPDGMHFEIARLDE